MNTDMTLEILSTSSEETENIGAAIGGRLKGGEVIELISDVGGGKTTLVKGLARGAGSADHVSSPTFTISKIYHAKTVVINHLDLYRLGDNPGVIALELDEALSQGEDVVVVEWASSVRNILPEQRLKLTISYLGENNRQIKIKYPEFLAYLLEGIKQ